MSESAFQQDLSNRVGITESHGCTPELTHQCESGANAESYVYVLENDTLHKRFVVTKRDGGQTVWILDGLSEGQTLVLD